MPALELVARSAGQRSAALVDSDAGALLDPQAKAAYRRRLAELDEDLGQAAEWSDAAQVTRLKLERDALLDQLAAATGLGGRNRVAASNAERARIAVRKAIVAAIDRVAHCDPAAARLLRDGTRTGRVCRYDPDPDRPVRWQLR